MEWAVPTLADVLDARRHIASYLRPTPLFRYSALDELLGTDVFVKHENHQPTGAFKVRGGVNLISQLSDDEWRRGVIAASTGNHGQSVAFGARIFGTRAIVCAPEKANPVKVEAMRGLGAEIVLHGPYFDAAREHCAELAPHGPCPRRLRDREGQELIQSGAIQELYVRVGQRQGEIGAQWLTRDDSLGKQGHVVCAGTKCQPSGASNSDNGEAVDRGPTSNGTASATYS